MRLLPGIAISALWLLAQACTEKKPGQLPPLGEVVVSINTDAEVPQFVGRLRIDLFDEGGRWFDSRDVARTNRDDWPASFSLYTNDQNKPRTVLLRARAYLEGRVRKYRGERFQDRTPYVEPPVADSLDDLCGNPPLFPLGSEVTLRRGRRTLTGYIPETRPPAAQATWTPRCRHQVAGGAVALRLDIAEAGDYRVEVTRVLPLTPGGGNTNLFIRTSCKDAQSQLACADDTDPTSTSDLLSNHLSSLVTHLDRGSYTVIASGHYPSPADVTLRADLVSKWDQWRPPPPVQAPVGIQPRLMVNGVDVTPEEEPQPLVTIDRLALLKVVPGQKQLAQLVLRTACGGLMAKLSRAANDAAPVLSEAETCLDKEGKRAPLTAEALEPFEKLPAQSLVGTFRSGEPCPTSAGPAAAICIPPGTFVFGAPEGPPRPIDATVPERFAVLNRFWLDRTEVTVARWRAALANGFKNPTLTPIENNARLATASDQGDVSQCTFSAAPNPAGQAREDFPVTCLDWEAARAFCQFAGGDLPTEAQWEYVATKAGRSFETRYPWGDQQDAPACGQAVFARFDSVDRSPAATVVCKTEGYGPVAITNTAVQNDTSPLGLLDLGGNVGEWALDGFNTLDSSCWNGSALTDPVCWEANAPLRTQRGGTWQFPGALMAGWSRQNTDPLLQRNFGNVVNFSTTYWGFGFRCAYQQAPK